MYKLLPDHPVFGKAQNIIRIEDGASIPMNPDNSDYQAYLKFLADGGTTLPAESN